MALGGNVALAGAGLERTFEAALQALAGEGVQVLRRSRLWRSAAWPDPVEAAFLNQVVLVATDLGPEALLAVLHGTERRFGRTRGRANAPRTLDLDLIAFGREVRSGPALTLPHPRAAERRFVMGPLAEIAPDWRHPVVGLDARTLAEHAPVGRDAEPLQA